MGRRAVGVAIAAQIPWLASLEACASDRSRTATLSASEMRTLRAFAAHIIPTDADSIGAADANAPEFVEIALTRPIYSASASIVRDGLADLNRRARQATAAGEFATATAAQQLAILHDVAATPFFTTTRTLVVIGTFADPSHGGNRNGAAWMMLGIDHKPSYAPPYGWYDAQATAQAS